ncbi:DUF433 domain-containing protein [Desulfoglaeba alkanexedens]|uniref:DUF433 domain-containing protein n=1 Tax=Desulfoglaeba alkanexedens ALDC TaxID=980445 RepID=A0A4P8L3K5_9BACT|nr:DUF433 domain-containing protein [Desulfoglaeba alkanexedens ALDC]
MNLHKTLDTTVISGETGSGETVEQILEAHPRLTREAIKAELAFAAKALRADVVFPTSGISS